MGSSGENVAAGISLVGGVGSGRASRVAKVEVDDGLAGEVAREAARPGERDLERDGLRAEEEGSPPGDDPRCLAQLALFDTGNAVSAGSLSGTDGPAEVDAEAVSCPLPLPSSAWPDLGEMMLAFLRRTL